MGLDLEDEEVSTGKWKATNPKDRAATTRLDLSLFPDTAIIAGTLAMVEGDCKYGGHNYRVSGVLASTYIAAAKRHMMKWFNGQNVDPKSLVPHLGNAIACLAVVLDSQACGELRDDRPPRCNIEGLLADAESVVKHLHKTFPNGPDRYTEVGVQEGAYNNDPE